MGSETGHVTLGVFVCLLGLLALSESCDNPTNCNEGEVCRGSCYINRNNEQYCYGQCIARNTTIACEDEYEDCANWLHLCSNSVVARFCKQSCELCNTEPDCRGFFCDGVCVPLTYLCDGVRDCRDGNDERDCNYIQELWYGSNGKRKCGIRTTPTSTVATQASFRKSLRRQNSARTKQLANSRRTRTKRLVNSKYAVAHSWPWTGIILSDSSDIDTVPLEPKKTFCGATLIHKDWAITAGHCVTTDGTVHSSEFIITFGKHFTRTAESERLTNQVRNASKILYFKDYEDSDIYNDVALLKLNESVVLNDYVNIVCMPRSSDVDQFYKTGGVTTGWGYDDTGKISHRLKQALVRPMERLQCRNQIYGFPVDYPPFLGPSIDASLLCTEIDRDGGFGVICDGDSGGPMVVRRSTGSYAMMGIASFGTDQDCSKPGEAAVFTSIYYFLPWISHFVDVTS